MIHPRRPDGDDDSAWIELRLLATSDLHMHIHCYDYFRDRPSGKCGLSALADLIDQARDEAPNVLLFDNGDFLQGSPLGDLALADPALGGSIAPHPMIAAMNELGYDAITLGNHEFNFGIPALERALADAGFPVALANVQRAPEPGSERTRPFLTPYVLLDRQVTDRSGRIRNLRVGVLGLVTPMIAVWDHAHLAGRLEVLDPVETARAVVPRMRAEGADLVVALHHSGVGNAEWTAGMENAAIPLARQCGIDVQILGHSHQIFPAADLDGQDGVDVPGGCIGGIPAVMPGSFGSHLGQIDLTLRLQADGAQVMSAAVRLHPAPDAPPAGRTAGRIASGMSGAHLRTLDHIRAQVGRADTPFDSYFALVAGDPTLSLMAEAQGNFVRQALAGSRWKDWPVLSAVATFLAGGRGGPENFSDIPAGPLLMRHATEMHRFPNAVRALAVSGAGLAEWLERSAAQFHQIAPGSRDRLLIDPAMPSYNFDVIYGLTYAIDLSVPPRFGPTGERRSAGGPRIADLRHQGRPVAPDDRFVVATNSYRACGGGGFPGLAGLEPVLTAPELSRDILIWHLRTVGSVRADRSAVWRFVAMPGTSVLFDTGPGAAQILSDHHGPEDRRITPLGLTGAGFLRCRLDL